jgi:hypothetical protein
MNVAMQIAPPETRGLQPRPGLGMHNFKCIAQGGFGDGHNSYAHSMAWFEGKLYVGTTRSNLCMIRVQSAYKNVPLKTWPIESPDTTEGLYTLDRRAQIWAYDPLAGTWEMVHRAPLVESNAGGEPVSREIGYRSMQVFQAESDPKPALYVAAWASGRAPGGHIMRTYDGRTFERASRYGILKHHVQATRCLTAFAGRVFFSPTSQPAVNRTGGEDGSQQNTAGLPLVFESRDITTQKWVAASKPGFGDRGNLGIFSLYSDGKRLYAGTFNLNGFQIWASECLGNPPYRWHKLVDRGAGRGALNQVVTSLISFDDAIFVGTGIQGGGLDRVNKIGPAAAELIRLNSDDSWDVIVGDPRAGQKNREALSGLRSGFGNFFNGYVWSLGVHDGWLYAGTYDWSIMLRWSTLREAPLRVVQFFRHFDPELFVTNEGGADLWRSQDGENWMPVTRQGFGNPFNAGIRNLVSTPEGLFAGTANMFGPRVAVLHGSEWAYEENPRGGLEIWLGNRGAAD